MASITKRSYSSWQVTAKDSTLKIKRTFLSKSEALGFAEQLEADGIAVAKPAKTETLAWQVRVRKKGFPELVETFTTKAEAQAWSVAREADMHQRKFVDYREAERHSLGDLMRKYANKVLKGKKADHPDLVRIHKICRHPITQIAMHMLQPSDVAAYRDQRLEGGFVEPVDTRKQSLALRTWSPVKGASVKKEMELISRIISIAMREWNIHLPFNPASGKHCTRPEAQDGDERNRRLEDRAPAILEQVQAGNVQRSRRKVMDLGYVLDPEIETLLKAAGGEQINLLRACRYPEWFRPQRKEVTAASLRSRKLNKAKPKIKARERKGLH